VVVELSSVFGHFVLSWCGRCYMWLTDYGVGSMIHGQWWMLVFGIRWSVIHLNADWC
jgi:hypothetical protein